MFRYHFSISIRFEKFDIETIYRYFRYIKVSPIQSGVITLGLKVGATTRDVSSVRVNCGKIWGHWLGHNIGVRDGQLGVVEGGPFPRAAMKFRWCRVLGISESLDAPETSQSDAVDQRRRRCQDNHFHGNRVTPASVNKAQIVMPMIYMLLSNVDDIRMTEILGIFFR